MTVWQKRPYNFSVNSEGLRVAVDFVGCKLNQAEVESIAWQLAEAGCKLVSADDKADIYILNTCTVTHIADRKSRHLLRMAHRRNPQAHIIAVGCYAQRAPDELARIEGVNLVVGNEQKSNLIQLLDDAGYLSGTSNGQRGMAEIFRTRAFIKVQDGCDNFCAYCIVPLVRGREKSVPIEHVVSEVRRRVAEGYKEVVLTGTEIGAYRYQGFGLKGLLERILAETEVNRLRLSSVQPQEISPELIDLWQDGRLCRHFHLSLQSGSDSVLRRMGRCYTTADYEEAVTLIRGNIPEVAITTDIIVGFPGETEQEFEESYQFCRRMDFSRIHVFSFSPREGTTAVQMPGQVKAKVKKQRSDKMLALAEESAKNFRMRFSGKTLLVLWEKQEKGIWSGLTDNYIRVYTESGDDLTNKLTPAKLVELRGDGVWGEKHKHSSFTPSPAPE